MTDRELLERAAKAAGIALMWHEPGGGQEPWCYIPEATAPHNRRAKDAESGTIWNPLADDGDALRLAVRLRIDFYTSNTNGLSERTEENAVVCHSYNPTVPVSSLVSLSEPFGADPYAATRRAIVRAAAAMA